MTPPDIDALIAELQQDAVDWSFASETTHTAHKTAALERRAASALSDTQAKLAEKGAAIMVIETDYHLLLTRYNHQSLELGMAERRAAAAEAKLASARNEGIEAAALWVGGWGDIYASAGNREQERRADEYAAGIDALKTAPGETVAGASGDWVEKVREALTETLAYDECVTAADEYQRGALSAELRDIISEALSLLPQRDAGTPSRDKEDA